jgi:hypothetical protein
MFHEVDFIASHLLAAPVPLDLKVLGETHRTSFYRVRNISSLRGLECRQLMIKAIYI